MWIRCTNGRGEVSLAGAPINRSREEKDDEDDEEDNTVTKCITPNCLYPQAPALKRGLCMRCYTSAKKVVEEGSVSWDELVWMGLALAAADDDPFMVALAKKMEGRDDGS